MSLIEGRCIWHRINMLAISPQLAVSEERQGIPIGRRVCEMLPLLPSSERRDSEWWTCCWVIDLAQESLALHQTAEGWMTKKQKQSTTNWRHLRGKFWSVDTILISWRDLFCPRSNSFCAIPSVDTQLIKKHPKAIYNKICFQNDSHIYQRQLILYCPFFLLLKN